MLTELKLKLTEECNLAFTQYCKFHKFTKKIKDLLIYRTYFLYSFYSIICNFLGVI